MVIRRMTSFFESRKKHADASFLSEKARAEMPQREVAETFQPAKDGEESAPLSKVAPSVHPTLTNVRFNESPPLDQQQVYQDTKAFVAGGNGLEGDDEPLVEPLTSQGEVSEGETPLSPQEPLSTLDVHNPVEKTVAQALARLEAEQKAAVDEVEHSNREPIRYERSVSHPQTPRAKSVDDDWDDVVEDEIGDGFYVLPSQDDTATEDLTEDEAEILRRLEAEEDENEMAHTIILGDGACKVRFYNGNPSDTDVRVSKYVYFTMGFDTLKAVALEAVGGNKPLHLIDAKGEKVNLKIAELSAIECIEPIKEIFSLEDKKDVIL